MSGREEFLAIEEARNGRTHCFDTSTCQVPCGTLTFCPLILCESRAQLKEFHVIFISVGSKQIKIAFVLVAEDNSGA